MDDLSYLEQLMGGASADTGASGGVYVVNVGGVVDDGLLRLIGKARVLADALGAYVYVLLAGGAAGDPQQAIHAGADQVLLAGGAPAAADLAAFLEPRAPQAVLFAGSRLGRELGPALAQLTNGSLCGNAADLAVDPIYQRVQAHQPILGDAARRVVTLLNTPAVAVVDTGALPAAFGEPWRTGQVEDLGALWGEALDALRPAELEAIAPSLRDADVVVAAGRGLRDRAGFALAEQLAARLGGVVAGDLGALDEGWIDEEHLVGLTGHTTAPRLYVALGIEGDTEHLGGVAEATTIVAVQPDPTAPITRVADWNVLADPAEFAQALLARLG